MISTAGVSRLELVKVSEWRSSPGPTLCIHPNVYEALGGNASLAHNSSTLPLLSPVVIATEYFELTDEVERKSNGKQ